jgi:acetyl/propionyl-CoA carboxylase alpha subunit
MQHVVELIIHLIRPGEDSIKAFGIKHVARDLAKASSVPIVPGTKGLVETEDEALAESDSLGFPVMLKITAGGGGKYLPLYGLLELIEG